MTTAMEAKSATPAPTNGSNGKATVHQIEEAKPRAETVRRRLPKERPALTHKFCVAGHEGYITVGLFEDGRPGEVFIRMSKQGSTVSGLTDAIGVMTSVALQHGVPLGALSEKFKNTRFDPQGVATGHPSIRTATSILDYIFRWLEVRFLDEAAPQDT